MIEWEKYYLKDNPFLATPIITVDKRDKRLNGRFFCEDVVGNTLQRILKQLDRNPNMIFVASDRIPRGTGKSALMAAAYWRLADQNRDAVWLNVTAGVSTASLVGRIFDSMVAHGYMKKLRKEIKTPTEDRVSNLLSRIYTTIPLGYIAAIKRILEQPDDQVASALSRTRLRIPLYSPIEVFEKLLDIFKTIKIDRFYFFIDQFEEYVVTTSPDRLSSELNDLIRACNEKATIIVTMHPDAEKIYSSAASGDLETLAPIDDRTRFYLPRFGKRESMILTEFYLSGFRTDNAKAPTVLYPFVEEAIKYMAEKTGWLIRDFMVALRNALIQGAQSGYTIIDKKFIMQDTIHYQIFGGTARKKV